MAGMYFKHLFIFSFFIWDSPQALGVVLMQDPQLGKVREIFLERGEHSVKPARWRREAAGERKEKTRRRETTSVVLQRNLTYKCRGSRYLCNPTGMHTAKGQAQAKGRESKEKRRKPSYFL